MKDCHAEAPDSSAGRAFIHVPRKSPYWRASGLIVAVAALVDTSFSIYIPDEE